MQIPENLTILEKCNLLKSSNFEGRLLIGYSPFADAEILPLLPFPTYPTVSLIPTGRLLSPTLITSPRQGLYL